MFNSLVFSLDDEWLKNIREANNSKINSELTQLQNNLKKDKNNPDIYAMIGICYHIKSERGEHVASKAIDYLNKSIKIKYDPFVDCFLGSAYTLKGGEKKNLNSLNGGFKIMDQAFQNDPENLGVIILILSNGVSEGIPYFVFNNRLVFLESLFEVVDKLNNQNKIISEDYLNLEYLKSLFFLKKEDLKSAISLWKKIVEENPDTIFGEKSKEMLTIYAE